MERRSARSAACVFTARLLPWRLLRTTGPKGGDTSVCAMIEPIDHCRHSRRALFTHLNTSARDRYEIVYPRLQSFVPS